MARRSTWIAMALVAVAACTSPTLPLPPPDPPSITTGTTPGTYRLSSDRGALPNALIVVVNRNTDLPRSDRVAGTLADENGSWQLELKARANDTLDISQESGTTRSPVMTVVVR